MHPRKSAAQHTLVFLALLLFCMGLRSDHRPVSRLARFPHTTLWAWERPEDLRAIDSRETAVAYLDQTLTIGPGGVSRRPRMQPVSYPVDAKLIAVVRIEAPFGAILSVDAEKQAVAALLLTAARPGIAALQIDFDATRSQRGFYRNMLHDLRQAMPADLPLSITALVSWCSYDDWIGALPVDEAVPMFFRMEQDRNRTWADMPVFRIREPLCMQSAGISTREPWPHLIADKRIYVFPDQGWHNDLALLEQRKLP